MWASLQTQSEVRINVLFLFHTHSSTFSSLCCSAWPQIPGPPRPSASTSLPQKLVYKCPSLHLVLVGSHSFYKAPITSTGVTRCAWKGDRTHIAICSSRVKSPRQRDNKSTTKAEPARHPSLWRSEEARGLQSQSPAWATQQIPDQHELHSKRTLL